MFSLLLQSKHGRSDSSVHQGGAYSSVWFLWLEGVSVAEINQRLLTQYGKSSLQYTDEYEGKEKFKSDQPVRAGRSSDCGTDDKIQEA